tara:strand:- start:3951 stop:4397 length:447 start_codon:yes stop_codon:yes gene_type:complete
MAHVRTTIRNRVAGNTVTGLSTTGSRVYESRIYPLGAGTLPGLCVYTKSEESEPSTIGSSRVMLRNLSLVIDGYVKAVSGYDDLVDTISAEVETAMANDATLAGLVKDHYLESTDIDFNEEGDKPVAVVSLTYVIQYATVENNPQQNI